ncbi:MAG: YdcF family protein [Deltaproteobacteria bacterium]|nr:YdcF family protein [Deltaproteobacteria bacterium]
MIPSRWRRPLALGLVVGAALASLPFVLDAREAPYLYNRPEAVPARAVALVLGARVLPDGTPGALLADRLAAARALYLRGTVRRVLVSGDHGRVGYDEVNAMRRWLVAHEVPSSAVVLDHAGFRTLDSMDRAARVFGVRSAVVCTQRFHLPRAVFLARSRGLDAVGLAADGRGGPGSRTDRLRERVAVARALADVYLLGTGARLVGPQIPADGDVVRSWDQATRNDVHRGAR